MMFSAKAYCELKLPDTKEGGLSLVVLAKVAEVGARQSDACEREISGMRCWSNLFHFSPASDLAGSAMLYEA